MPVCAVSPEVSLSTQSNNYFSFIYLIVVFQPFWIGIPGLYKQTNKQTPWPQSASELYRPSDHSLWVKLVRTFADRGRHVVSVTDPYGHILDFLDRTFFYMT
jgi:hypothetical protein